MKAVVIDDWGGAPAFRDIPVPEPGPGEVLIKIQAVGVNPFDEKIRMGEFAQMPHQFPYTLGLDFAGTVDRLGEGATRFQPGDAVFGEVFKIPLHDGSYAAYATVPEAGPLARQPNTITAPEAAALPMPGMTALVTVDAIDPQPGQVVLIVGATGGIGGYATQLVAGAGAKVIATALGDEADYVRELGASDVIDYRRRDVVEAVRAAHPDGIDALIDTVSTPEQMNALATLVRPDGRIAGPAPGPGQIRMDVEALAQRQITGTNTGNPASGEVMARLARLVNESGLRVLPLACLPLEEAPQALEQYRSGHVRGKIVPLPNGAASS
jgi:NADPH2:quinone reductase